VHCGDPGPARTLARMGFQVLPSYTPPADEDEPGPRTR